MSSSRLYRIRGVCRRHVSQDDAGGRPGGQTSGDLESEKAYQVSSKGSGVSE